MYQSHTNQRREYTSYHQNDTFIDFNPHISFFSPFFTIASGFIIQWNCRGLSANRQELELLAQKYNAPVICLQETNLKYDQMTLKGYVAYHKAGTIDDMDRAHGGVSTFV